MLKICFHLIDNILWQLSKFIRFQKSKWKRDDICQRFAQTILQNLLELFPKVCRKSWVNEQIERRVQGHQKIRYKNHRRKADLKQKQSSFAFISMWKNEEKMLVLFENYCGQILMRTSYFTQGIIFFLLGNLF